MQDFCIGCGFGSIVDFSTVEGYTKIKLLRCNPGLVGQLKVDSGLVKCGVFPVVVVGHEIKSIKMLDCPGQG